MDTNAKSVIPLYFQVQQAITSAIVAGTLAPGSQLPPEAELIRQYGISRTTVRKAVQELERSGLIEIRRGRGTFVREHKLAQEFTGLTGFVEDMVALGVRPSARVLSTGPLKADETVARRLGVPIGTEVMQIRRVRLADDVTLSLDETYLPMDLGRKVVQDDLEVYPIFSLLEQKYATPLWEADYWVEAVPADRMIAEALAIAERSSILLIERISYTADRRPVDYERLFYRGDRIRLATRLKRQASPIPLDAMPKLTLKSDR